MSALIYVHCALRAPRRPSLAGRWPRLPGGGAPRPLGIGHGLWAIVSPVSGVEYGAEALADRLSDIDWLAECGAVHHAVVARAGHRRAVVPFRLLTLFRSEARAIEHLARARRRIERALDRLGGRREWVVRVVSVPGAARKTASRPESGTDYLLARAATRRRASSRSPEALRAARAFVRELARGADRVVRRRVSEPPHVLQEAVLLVPKAGEKNLAALTRRWSPRLAAAGCRASLSGPWPPYSFVSLDGGPLRREGRTAGG